MLKKDSKLWGNTSGRISSLGRLQQLSLYRKTFEVRCVAEERVVFSLYNGNHLHGISFKTEVATSFYSNFIVGREQSGSMGFMKLHPYQNELCDNKWECLDNWSYSTGGINVPQYEGMGDLKFVASSSVSSREQELMDLTDRVIERTNIMPESVDAQNITTTDVIPDDPASVSDTLTIDSDSLSSVKTNIGDIFAGFSESINASVNKGETALKNSIDKITSSVTSALKGVNGAVDNTFSKVTSSVDQMGESADNKFTGFSNALKEASNKIGAITVDVLRHAIVQIENSLNQGATFVVYAYGSTKNLLPSEVQNVLSSSEERVVTISRPVGTAFQQIYTALEGLEKSLGLDPNDPIIPFVLFIGASAALWGSYWLFTYGGYEGDLTPKSTLELLRGKDDVVLIDDLRERYGIPDLRRAARFRYGNVTLPEVDGSVRKLLKSGKDLDDTLIAAVIRNLKIIQRPYLVQGGFQSWVKEGLRVKELKPETTLTIINEEAEAILEDINPTPVKVVGYGVTIYRRIASYEDAEDFKQDVRQLLAPLRLGGQAISWAAGKLETNGIGLPTSPSSSDVQNRVLQAAAKHESQPSDGEETQDSSPNLTENVDLSEA
ncbi:rhodanese/cell cycle control phosphatase superfamily protein [Actinidia rufa]|uniref:Rhodanese/cell cycle control phosphatase superfamily protein n=1 Tax=Actinidia rufa TaxID=165716 RepID=A0A7J0E470_9ERIC|nr:rhodanese/cell cycle control phosphatase superfamily protein [Actinidia rufa]